MTTQMAKDIMIQNLKDVCRLKSCGKSDRDICLFLGISLASYLEVLSDDDYIREKVEKAQSEIVSDIEEKFLAVVDEKLKSGDTADAKWVLERLNGKYQKKDVVDVNVKRIDEIIRERT
jgi:hypothetical protein